ncbi:hypothetical protein K502DRAFT_345488 [Neoconidiobolus thromboides FSU 785]|nr:hypothetical protein K502DRAFT_345488 [Neoconidiobolus thromboides FSU 785]
MDNMDLNHQFEKLAPFKEHENQSLMPRANTSNVWLPSIKEHIATTTNEFPPPLVTTSQLYNRPSSPRRLSLPSISSFDIPRYQQDNDDLHRKHSLPIPEYSSQLPLHANFAYECGEKECRAKFPTLEAFRSHLTIHNLNQGLHCPFNGCTKTYVRPNKYAAHYRSHYTNLLPNILPNIPPIHETENETKLQSQSRFCLEPDAFNMNPNDTFRRFSTPAIYNSQHTNLQGQYPNSMQTNLRPMDPSDLVGRYRPRVASLDFGKPGPGRPGRNRSWYNNNNNVVWEGLDGEGNPIKYFLCQVQGCFMKFKRSEHLRRHQGVHTQERPFVCPNITCNKRFSRSDNLRQHLRIHDRVKKYNEDGKGAGCKEIE